jgi:eukaryotic-like serine/threonine-protein kinase
MDPSPTSQPTVSAERRVSDTATTRTLERPAAGAPEPAEPARAAPRKSRTDRPSRPLGMRIFLLSGTLIAASVAVAVGFTAIRARQVAEEGVKRALDASQAVQESFEAQRGQQLRLISRIVASDPNFVAYVAEADPVSIRDLLEQRRQALGCDFAMVLDRTGRVLARTDRPGTGQDLSGHALIQLAVERGEASEVWLEDGRLASAVATPLLSGMQVVEGVLVTGFALDDPLALLLKRAADADIAFLAFDGDATRVTASTLGAVANELVGALDRARSALARARAGDDVPRSDLRLDGRPWVARLIPQRDAAGVTVGAVAVLAPLDRYLTGFRSVAGALLLAGVIGVLGAFALSWAFSRRVTGPIERLARAAEAARAGDYTVTVPTEGNDEVDRLGHAFRGLLGELREQRELEQYLSQLTRQIPDAAAEEPAIDAQPVLKSGARLGDRFEVLGVLGAGGFGVVYRARDRALQDVVALKVLRREQLGGAEALERLKSELRLARRVTHRHVLRTHDFGEVGEVAFISMEYVRGVTLRHLLEHGGPLPLAAVLRITRQLVGALEAAHGMGVLHGDIKPENLLLEPTGNLKLTDFGIARPLRFGRSSGDGRLAGTLHYLSPDQLQGRDIDVRSDLYACGVVMFEMLTGRRPFVTSDATELFHLQMNQDPPHPRTLRPEISATLDELVVACLAREPAARPASAAELFERLTGLESRGGGA